MFRSVVEVAISLCKVNAAKLLPTTVWYIVSKKGGKMLNTLPFFCWKVAQSKPEKYTQSRTQPVDRPGDSALGTSQNLPCQSSSVDGDELETL